MTPSKQEIAHPTCSSSSSTSPTTTVSSDSGTRAREDLSGIDSHPASVSSSHVEEMIERGDLLLPKPTRKQKPNKNEDHDLERGDPLCSDIPEWLQEFRENLVDDRVPERRDSHASSSHEVSLETHIQEKLSTVFILISLRTEIARSVRELKLKGPRAEDAMVEPYLVQKMLVT